VLKKFMFQIITTFLIVRNKRTEDTESLLSGHNSFGGSKYGLLTIGWPSIF
jgi:hypothetical protein